MSNTQMLAVGPNPTLDLRKVNGHLTVTGWDRPELLARGPRDGDLRWQAGTSTVEVRCDNHCLLQTPLQSRLQARKVDGNAAVNLVLGAVTLEQVDGHLKINSTGAVSLGHVGGNFDARAVAGSLTATNVEGSGRFHQIAGDLRLGKVDGNLSAAEIVGNISAEVDGNVQLRVNLARGQHIQVTADGNIILELQPDAAAKVRLEADGKIRVLNLGEVRKARETCLEFDLGAGSGTDSGAVIDLRADGDITLVGGDAGSFGPTTGFGAAFAGAAFDPEFGDEMGRRAAELGQQISEQVEAQVAAFTRDLEEKVTRMNNNEEMANKIQNSITYAVRRAEEKLAEAMRKMEVRAQEAQRRGYEGDRRRKGYGWQAPPTPPPAPQPPPPPKRPQATDEERMMILRMVEQGKISVEQAETLLAALNG